MKDTINCQAFSRIYDPLSLVKLVCTYAYQMKTKRTGKLQVGIINSNISFVLFFLITIIMTLQWKRCPCIIDQLDIFRFWYISGTKLCHYYKCVFCCT